MRILLLFVLTFSLQAQARNSSGNDTRQIDEKWDYLTCRYAKANDADVYISSNGNFSVFYDDFPILDRGFFDRMTDYLYTPYPKGEIKSQSPRDQNIYDTLVGHMQIKTVISTMRDDRLNDVTLKLQPASTKRVIKSGDKLSYDVFDGETGVKIDELNCEIKTEPACC